MYLFIIPLIIVKFAKYGRFAKYSQIIFNNSFCPPTTEALIQRKQLTHKKLFKQEIQFCNIKYEFHAEYFLSSSLQSESL